MHHDSLAGHDDHSLFLELLEHLAHYFARAADDAAHKAIRGAFVLGTNAVRAGWCRASGNSATVTPSARLASSARRATRTSSLPWCRVSAMVVSQLGFLGSPRGPRFRRRAARRRGWS